MQRFFSCQSLSSSSDEVGTTPGHEQAPSGGIYLLPPVSNSNRNLVLAICSMEMRWLVIAV